ncbi:hypothetical protein DRE_01036 [Drechslerella stenobrocha 248]|uniref:Uncharacterized protein n=1 Tax=Drechslerella stenobrocha 248 TaxID=1043628 RepID=W7HXY1_9PEZI|nr:hypothetical protein DRE_01036 [Drechslerella stenobrocha 248]
MLTPRFLLIAFGLPAAVWGNFITRQSFEVAPEAGGVVKATGVVFDTELQGQCIALWGVYFEDKEPNIAMPRAPNLLADGWTVELFQDPDCTTGILVGNTWPKEEGVDYDDPNGEWVNIWYKLERAVEDVRIHG